MTYNIIGDIHGRNNWEKLADPHKINIFVGDYFDPYEYYSFEDLKQNFLNIINFAKTNDCILLLGNHDLHYIHRDDYSRLDSEHAEDILNLFLDNIHMFKGVAYALNDDILVSHAGFTTEWLESTGYPISKLTNSTATELAEWANTLFWDGYTETSKGFRGWVSPMQSCMLHFTFSAKAKFSDYYGTSPKQSPAWVRPGTLDAYNAMPEGIQIVGHTQVCKVTNIQTTEGNGRIILTDCLGQDQPGSLTISISEDNTVEYNVITLQ